MKTGLSLISTPVLATQYVSGDSLPTYSKAHANTSAKMAYWQRQLPRLAPARRRSGCFQPTLASRRRRPAPAAAAASREEGPGKNLADCDLRRGEPRERRGEQPQGARPLTRAGSAPSWRLCPPRLSPSDRLFGVPAPTCGGTSAESARADALPIALNPEARRSAGEEPRPRRPAAGLATTPSEARSGAPRVVPITQPLMIAAT